jgi:Histidine kinase-, DNA gyrase B-, and HSP90-like ATPase
MRKNSATSPSDLPISLGENPVNAFHAREYARESSPGILAVILELTENARDNATEVILTIDIESCRSEGAHHILIPNKIVCEDNGVGLTHAEFLTKFCGAYSESESHHEVDRAGRNGVGTKTYTSVAERIVVKTTTGRPTEGLDPDRNALSQRLPSGLSIPFDGQPDILWRVYEFRLHTRAAIPSQWAPSNANEMGTRVELCDLYAGTEIPFEILIERLSYNREWVQSAAHGFIVQLTGKVPPELGKSKRISLRPWSHPVRNWLTEVRGRSDELVTVYDPTAKSKLDIPAATEIPGAVEFDFRVIGKGSDGQMQTLDKPALLLEVCGALPYPPNLEGVVSTRTVPLLSFLGLEHASSIGAFCNAVCGHARINSLPLKQALRNNKTTLASGPGTETVEALRKYLQGVLNALHRAWYNATRSSQDEAVSDAVKEAQEEVNLAMKGANPSSQKGDILKPETSAHKQTSIPARRHRWECGACGKHWLASAGFAPKLCAETQPATGKGDGCGSDNIGLAKNQPRVGDCQIRIDQLGDQKIPAVFQFERASEDLERPVVRVNLLSPRYIELRGLGSMSGQAQRRLKQYLVDVSLVSIANFYSEALKTDFVEEWGRFYFNRMLRCWGVKEYEAQVAKLLQATSAEKDEKALVASK